MLLGIALGVAVVVAIDLANASVERAFLLSTEAVMGKTTHQIKGMPNGISDSVYTALKTQLEIDKAAPVINQLVYSPEVGERPLQLMGVDLFAETLFRDYLAIDNQLIQRNMIRLLIEPGSVLLPESLVGGTSGKICAQLLQGGSDCQITLDISGKLKTVKIVGFWSVAKDRGSGIDQKYIDNLLITDLSTAQELLNRVGNIDRIDLILPDDCNETGQSTPDSDIPCPEIEKIRKILPQNAYLESVQVNKDIADQMTSAFRLNLTALSLLTLIVGMFLIYNTMTFSIVRRRPVFGIMRCLGLTRQELFFQILGEALIVGITGTVAGVLVGILLGQGSVRLVTQTINDLYFVLSVRGVQIPLISLIKGSVIGIFTTLLAAAPPALEAASIPPITALNRAGLEKKAQDAIIVASMIGLILIAAGGGLLLISDRGLISSFAGTLGVILGFAMITPVITRHVMRFVSFPLGKILGALGRMAPLNVIGALSRTAVAVAALTVAIAVTIGLNLMIDSFRYTIQVWLEETLRGDIYITVASPTTTLVTSPIDPKILSELERFTGIARIDVLRSVEVRSDQGPIHVAASSNPDLARERLYLKSQGSPELVSQQLVRGEVLISEPLANRLGIQDLDETITLSTATGPRNFEVAGIFYDYSTSQGTLLMTLDTYRTFWADETINAIALRVEDGQDVTQIVDGLIRQIAPLQALDIKPNQQLRADALAVFDRTFTIANALRGLAVIVAFVGLLAASLAWQLDKSREIGILRAIGMTSRQIWGLILAETGLIGSVAGILSMPAGYVLALILIYIINKRSFGWTLQMQIDYSIFLQAYCLAVFAALLSGLYPAFKMGRSLPAETLRSE